MAIVLHNNLNNHSYTHIDLSCHSHTISRTGKNPTMMVSQSDVTLLLHRAETLSLQLRHLIKYWLLLLLWKFRLNVATTAHMWKTNGLYVYIKKYKITVAGNSLFTALHCAGLQIPDCKTFCEVRALWNSLTKKFTRMGQMDNLKM